MLETLWRDQRASFADERLSFDGIHQMPKPRQPGGVPVWVSGTANRRSARRLARFGHGWIPWGPAAADPVTGIAEMRALVEAEGRSFDGIEVVGAVRALTGSDGAVDLVATMAGVPDLAAAGVTDVRLSMPVPADPSAAHDVYAAAVEAFRAVAPAP
ncbi:MAG TPA: hypothetical protein VF228_12185 [Iamia sp.]